MDSLSFYYHDHELAAVQKKYDDFFALDEEPEVDYCFTNNKGQEIKVFKLHQIIGTVIDKNKLKNSISLLTPTGVVQVKIYKNQYAIYDKQLSQKDNDGKKHVIEKSWFTKGTMLMVQGIRRGTDFIPKKMKKSTFPILSKITNIKEDGTLEFQFERQEVD
jgi:DNA polymerase-3 subunit alpha